MFDLWHWLSFLGDSEYKYWTLEMVCISQEDKGGQYLCAVSVIYMELGKLIAVIQVNLVLQTI